MRPKDKRLIQLHHLLQELIWMLNGEYTSEHYHLFKDEEGLTELDESSMEGAEYSRDVLRQYVDSWLESDSNYAKWRRANPELFQDINRNLSTTRLKLTDRKIDDQLHPNVRVSTPTPLDADYRRDQAATWLFLQFINSALRERLGKCLKCKHYFFLRSARQNGMYCSRECATRMTAIISTNARRLREHNLKLERSRKELKKTFVLRKKNHWYLTH